MAIKAYMSISGRCTAHETSLMARAREVQPGMIVNGVGSGAFMDSIETVRAMVGHTALRLGTVSGAWRKHLDFAKQTLADIDELYRKSIGGLISQPARKLSAEILVHVRC